MVVFIEAVCELDWNLISHSGNFLANKKPYVLSEQSSIDK